MKKNIRNSIIVVSAVLFISVFATQSIAAKLFYLYVPHGVNVLKAEVNTYDVIRVPVLNTLVGKASVRLVYQNHVGEIERYTLRCIGENGSTSIVLPINVEAYYADDIEEPYLVFID